MQASMQVELENVTLRVWYEDRQFVMAHKTIREFFGWEVKCAHESDPDEDIEIWRSGDHDMISGPAGPNTALASVMQTLMAFLSDDIENVWNDDHEYSFNQEMIGFLHDNFSSDLSFMEMFMFGERSDADKFTFDNYDTLDG